MILLRQQRDNPEWNASMLPYWESLPGLGGSITKENMPTDGLHLLQDPVLAGLISCPHPNLLQLVSVQCSALMIFEEILAQSVCKKNVIVLYKHPLLFSSHFCAPVTANTATFAACSG